MKNESDKWRIRVHPLADEDMKRLKHDNPVAFKQMMSALKQLAGCPNLFDVCKPLDICYTWPDATDWLRFKCRGERWRVALRLIVDGQQVRPTQQHRPCDGYLQVVFVDERSAVTYRVRLAVREVAVW